MGDVVLPKIKWLELDLTGDEPVLSEIGPLEKIHIGHVKQFCRHGITTGSIRELLEKYKALRKQYGHRMEKAALEYLDSEIEALERHAKS